MMAKRLLLLTLLAWPLMLFTAPAAQAQPSSIKVKKMHCAGCAQRIASRLFAVKGVTDVQVDIEAKTLYVTAKKEVKPSPKAMWEAVEKANDTPVLLVCPAGTFTEKPKS